MMEDATALDAADAPTAFVLESTGIGGVGGLGMAMSGGLGRDSSRKRRDGDFYPTPPEAPLALARVEMPTLAHLRIWEPACGNGEMARALLRSGLVVPRATDLVDRGYGFGGVDFLTTVSLDGCDAIITNPPFDLAVKFIRHALGALRTPYLALLLKATFWHAASRIALFEAFPPSVIYPLTWRVDFLAQGAPTMDTMWCVWDVERGGTTYELLHRVDTPATERLL